MPRSIARRSREIVLLFRRAERWFTSHSENALCVLNRRTISAAQRAISRARRKKNDTSGSGVLRLLGYQFELVRHSAQLGKRTGLHLVHQTAAMHLHGGFGNADIAGNLFAYGPERIDDRPDVALDLHAHLLDDQPRSPNWGFEPRLE